MKRILIVLLMTVMVVACSKDDDDNGNTVLEGRWTLTNVSCFCYFGENPDFSGNKLVFEGNNLKVENSGDFNFFANEVGNFTIQGDVITFNNGLQYTYVVNPGVLELTFVDDPGIADDEILFAYKKDG